MSAISGIEICRLISPSAFAASIVGTVQRISSQPASSSRWICATVAFTSSVLVFVMDWIRIGFPPPMTRSPILTVLVCSLVVILLAPVPSAASSVPCSRCFVIHSAAAGVKVLDAIGSCGSAAASMASFISVACAPMSAFPLLSTFS